MNNKTSPNRDIQEAANGHSIISQNTQVEQETVPRYRHTIAEILAPTGQLPHNNSPRIKIEAPELFYPNPAVPNQTQFFNVPQNVVGVQQQVKFEPQTYDEHDYDNLVQQNQLQNNNIFNSTNPTIVDSNYQSTETSLPNQKGEETVSNTFSKHEISVGKIFRTQFFQYPIRVPESNYRVGEYLPAE